MIQEQKMRLIKRDAGKNNGLNINNPIAANLSFLVALKKKVGSLLKTWFICAQ